VLWVFLTCFDSFRVTREQALNYRELVSGKRGLFGLGSKPAGEAAGAATKGVWGKRIKNFLISAVVGGVAAIAGTSIYGSMNPNSPALGGSGESKPKSTTDTSQAAATDPAYATTGPAYTTTGPAYTTTSPGYSTTPSGYAAANENGSSSQVVTVPSTSGTGVATTRAIAERAREERAPDHKMPVDISGESSIPSHV